MLAERVIGGWPHGHAFDAPVNLTITLAQPAEVVEVLYKADDETTWVVLSEETWAQPSDAEVHVRAETLCYFALLKTNATSSSSSGFVVGEGVVFGEPSAAPTAFACPGGESLYYMHMTCLLYTSPSPRDRG